MKQLRTGLICFFVLFVLVAGVYPLLVTQFSQILFTDRANGSLLLSNNAVIGSKLIGQTFNQATYFQGRPSASGYNGEASGGSNLSPQGVSFADQVEQRRKTLKLENQEQKQAIPDILLTSSGSGLDPDISPEGALWQVPRIAAERKISEENVRRLIQQFTESPPFYLGEPTVNVLLLNLALDKGI